MARGVIVDVVWGRKTEAFAGNKLKLGVVDGDFSGQLL